LDVIFKVMLQIKHGNARLGLSCLQKFAFASRIQKSEDRIQNEMFIRRSSPACGGAAP